MKKVNDETLASWLGAHPGWTKATEAGPDTLVRTYTFPDFAAALGYVVVIGAIAQAKDHHPDVKLGWGKVELRWSTHDAGGLTERDLALADESDRRYAR